MPAVDTVRDSVWTVLPEDAQEECQVGQRAGSSRAVALWCLDLGAPVQQLPLAIGGHVGAFAVWGNTSHREAAVTRAVGSRAPGTG